MSAASMTSRDLVYLGASYNAVQHLDPKKALRAAKKMSKSPADQRSVMLGYFASRAGAK